MGSKSLNSTDPSLSGSIRIQIDLYIIRLLGLGRVILQLTSQADLFKAIRGGGLIGKISNLSQTESNYLGSLIIKI